MIGVGRICGFNLRVERFVVQLRIGGSVMEITLEKIELVKDRTGVSYKDAKEALENANGSVVDAIISIEEAFDEMDKASSGGAAGAVVAKLKEIIRKGNVSKVVVKKEGEIVLNLPVTVGVLGAVITPIGALLAVITAFGTKCVIEVVKDDGSIIDVSEMAADTFDTAMEKGSIIADEVKERSAEVYHNVKSKTEDALSKIKKGEDEYFGMEQSDDDFDELADLDEKDLLAPRDER